MFIVDFCHTTSWLSHNYIYLLSLVSLPPISPSSSPPLPQAITEFQIGLPVLCSSQMVLVVKNLPANTGDIRDAASNPGSGRYLEVKNDNPLQYSCLDNFMDRGAWQTTVHGAAKSRTSLSDWALPLGITLSMVVSICQRYLLNSTHSLILPLCPQVCSPCLCLHSFLANRFSTIFLDPIYVL